jgi:O-antigen ligase
LRIGSPILSRLFEWQLPAALLVFLPTAGLVAGPAYAPLVFAVGGAQFIHRALASKRLPPFDASLLTLAILFAGLCWISAAWSIVPERSLVGGLQVTGILLGALVFLTQPALSEQATAKAMRAMALSTLAGAAILAFDASAGYPIQRFLSGDAPNAATKYNRGVAYAVLILWPVLGRLWRERAWRFVLPLVLGLALAVVIDTSLTAKIAALAAVAALLVSSLAPRLLNWTLAAGTTFFAAAAPFLLRLLSDYRDALFPYLKQSGQVRLEIWNYMTARVLERPILGWGFWSAGSVPIRAREFAGYVWVHRAAPYPHDQWLQLWVETGLFGAAFAIALILLALKRARELPAAFHPFAAAAFAAAVTISLANFDLATDSWWAALAVCAYLFKTVASAQRGGS